MTARRILPIRISIHRDRIEALVLFGGHAFIASIELPPFALEDPRELAAVLPVAREKAGRAVCELLGRMIGAETPFVPEEAENDARRS